MKSATKVIVSSLSALMGLAGIEHGIGEVLQGSVAPGGVMIQSWPESEFFRLVSGEPAMTIVPNLLVTGILAILFSMAFLVWATLLVERKNSGLVLILLSIIMLLVGGGIFPPIFGMMLGVLATRINATSTWWRTHLSLTLRRFLGKVWPWSFGFCLSAWLGLFPGTSILGYFFGVDDPSYVVMLILLALGSLLLTVFSGFVQDSQRRAAI